jgi:hypothetical protein
LPAPRRQPAGFRVGAYFRLGGLAVPRHGKPALIFHSFAVFLFVVP